MLSKHNTRIISIILILVILITASVSMFWIIYRPGPLKKDTVLTISTGKNITQISNELAAKDIIDSPYLFKIIGYIFSKFGIFFKVGEYKIHKYSSIATITKILILGESIIYKLTIPEGYSINQILPIIASNQKLSGKIDFAVEEGELMPSTYFYLYNDTKNNLIKKMHYDMLNLLEDLYKKVEDKSILKNSKDLLILASIVEKESSDDIAKSKVAAVFLNRLKCGMKLQSDVTVIYALTFGKSTLNRDLNYKDLKTPSEYNTYYIDGLPKKPICCPGIKSIEAVINPAEINAIYFITDHNNKYYFSTNLNEHNNYKLQFKKLR
ncbi:endolytic transglycosylase MltG [Rickettsia endosymbiont of Cardiosporidium cionae]|uniref:endolytic transglycosylase MltG n=1 Tax=Rickettsia endosymbiont of Cardiosporidium cionae TaxID=2777155 RepID=UPI00189344DD|nr:endolytic transglycosylase MltG [Rickettsia endosymbiont of Cardiosporidium cionae]KAF8818635.1 endolytic transglycosylase MltG [Rickettsia endosymbiont of Cardiosporidium cionae]